METNTEISALAVDVEVIHQECSNLMLNTGFMARITQTFL